MYIQKCILKGSCSEKLPKTGALTNEKLPKTGALTKESFLI